MNQIVSTLKRVFVMLNEKAESVELLDPDRLMSPEEVLNFYANLYPILTTAKISPSELRNDRIEYTFSSVMGDKG